MASRPTFQSATELAAALTANEIPADPDLAYAHETASHELAAVHEVVAEAFREITSRTMGAVPGTHASERQAERAVRMVIERVVRELLDQEIETGEQVRANG